MGETKPNETAGTKLKRIAERSGREAKAKFRWLMPHYNVENLTRCFHELDGTKAVGADRVTKIPWILSSRFLVSPVP